MRRPGRDPGDYALASSGRKQLGKARGVNLRPIYGLPYVTHHSGRFEMILIELKLLPQYPGIGPAFLRSLVGEIHRLMGRAARLPFGHLGFAHPAGYPFRHESRWSVRHRTISA